MSVYVGKQEKALSGVKELDAQLATLSLQMQGKLLRSAVRASIKPAFDLAYGTMPVGTRWHRLTKTYGRRLVAPGFAKRNLKIWSGINKQTGKPYAYIGVNAPAFYAVQFWEYGFKSVPPNPWLTPAFKSSRNQMVGLFAKELQKKIKTAIRRKNRAPRVVPA